MMQNARLSPPLEDISKVFQSKLRSIKLVYKQVVIHHNTTASAERYEQHQQIANSNKPWQNQYQQTNTTYQTSKQGKDKQALCHKSLMHLIHTYILFLFIICLHLCVFYWCVYSLCVLTPDITIITNIHVFYIHLTCLFI